MTKIARALFIMWIVPSYAGAQKIQCEPVMEIVYDGFYKRDPTVEGYYQDRFSLLVGAENSLFRSVYELQRDSVTKSLREKGIDPTSRAYSEALAGIPSGNEMKVYKDRNGRSICYMNEFSGVGYVADDEIDAESRLQNIEELLNKAAAYEEDCEERDEKGTLSGFLEEVALVADIDSLEEDQDYVVLMTLHSAKGLEFPHVYLAGMEDGLFPSYMTITGDDPEELEEERRLCYVGITRAEQKLTLTCARKRMVRGETKRNPISRFISEIPPELLDTGRSSAGNTYSGGFGFGNADDIESGTFAGTGRGRHFGKAYGAAAKKPFTALTKGSQLTAQKSDKLSYGVGDRVRHVKFGEGTVLDIKEGGRDFEVTVEFDTAGVRKMFAMFAKLVKI